MAFKDYIQSLPETRTTQKRVVINLIAEKCGVHFSTVYKWLKGDSKPDKLKQEKIAEITGIPIDSLFN